MEAEEIKEIINKCQYCFTSEEVPNPDIYLPQTTILFPIALSTTDELTPAMEYIYKWKSIPPYILICNPSAQSKIRKMTCAMY